MRRATLINTTFSVEVLPTELRYSAVTEMYPGSFQVPTAEGPVDVPMNVIEVQFEIYAGKWKKVVESLDEEGNPVQQEQWVDFLAPVLFDQNKKAIPYALYLLIESYRDQPTAEKLALINEQVGSFVFENSMEGFVLQVSEIV